MFDFSVANGNRVVSFFILLDRNCSELLSIGAPCSECGKYSEIFRFKFWFICFSDLSRCR